MLGLQASYFFCCPILWCFWLLCVWNLGGISRINLAEVCVLFLKWHFKVLLTGTNSVWKQQLQDVCVRVCRSGFDGRCKTLNPLGRTAFPVKSSVAGLTGAKIRRFLIKRCSLNVLLPEPVWRRGACTALFVSPGRGAAPRWQRWWPWLLPELPPHRKRPQ